MATTAPVVTQSSADASLAGLRSSAGRFKTPFKNTDRSFQLFVPADQTEVTLTATPTDAKARIEYSTVQPVALRTGVQQLVVTVTAENGTWLTYVVSILRMVPLCRVPPGADFHLDPSGNSTAFTISQPYLVAETEVSREVWIFITGLPDPTQTWYSGSLQDPVQRVNWYHALVFCNRLSAWEGLTPVYSLPSVDNPSQSSVSPDDWGDIPTSVSDSRWDAVSADFSATGYRLPTEAEWQWAAMAANDAPSLRFSGSTGSNAIEAYAWFLAPSITTQATGLLLPNGLGLRDLSGNVAEWCGDWFAAYPGSNSLDYRGPASGTGRAVRGGSWSSAATGCTVAVRSAEKPWAQVSTVGFRVVRRNGL